ncbi:outer membrane lipoprotein carrier protein LolA [bacterium]|nr:outer membrane lipoprotein carrier protein LolA [bacterium]
MKTKNLTAMVICFLIFFGYTAVFGEDADDIISKVQKKYKSAEDIVIHFNRVFTWSLSGRTNTLKGKLYIKGEKFIKYEMDDQVVVTNGKDVWSYSSATNQTIVDVYKSDEDEFLPRELIFNFHKRYESKYMKREKIGDVNCYVIEAVPKTDNEIQFLKVWIDSKRLTTMKIEYTNINDDVITYNIFKISFDNNLKEDFFLFKSPQGAEIIDLRNQ